MTRSTQSQTSTTSGDITEVRSQRVSPGGSLARSSASVSATNSPGRPLAAVRACGMRAGDELAAALVGHEPHQPAPAQLGVLLQALGLGWGHAYDVPGGPWTGPSAVIALGSTPSVKPIRNHNPASASQRAGSGSSSSPMIQ